MHSLEALLPDKETEAALLMCTLMQERLGKACQIIYSVNACWLMTDLHSISSELYLSFSLAALNLRTINERQCFTTSSLFLALRCSETHHKVLSLHYIFAKVYCLLRLMWISLEIPAQ